MLIVSGTATFTTAAPRSRRAEGALSHSPVNTSSDSPRVEVYSREHRQTHVDNLGVDLSQTERLIWDSGSKRAVGI